MQERARIAPGERVRIVGARSVYEVRDREYGARAAALPWGETIKWGPIVAGLLSAITSLLVLGALGAAIGLGADPGAAQGQPSRALPNAAIWAAIAGLISFFIGGYVASRFAATIDRPAGAMQGALVFMLAIPLMLWLGAQGAGAAASWLGGPIGGWAVDPTPRDTTTVPDAAATAEALRNTAIGTLLGSLLGLAAGAVGGWLGALRPAIPVDDEHERTV